MCLKISKKPIAFLLSVLLAVSATFCLSSFTAFGQVNWNYDENNRTLYFDGAGTTGDFTQSKLPEWSKYSQSAENIVFSDGIAQIGNYAFLNFSKVKSVSFPSSLKSIGYASFYGCENLKSAEFSDKSDKIEMIDSYAFFETALDFAEFKSSVKELGDYSFGYGNNGKKDGFYFICKPADAVGKYAFENGFKVLSNTVLDNEYDISFETDKETFYFFFTPTHSGEYSFKSTGVFDTFAVLYNENFEKISENDDEGIDCNHNLKVHLERGKTYCFSTKPLYSSQSGKYPVHLTVLQKDKEYAVSGTVFELADKNGNLKNAVSGVQVKCDDCENTAVTDEKGEFTLSLQSETHTITLSSPTGFDRKIVLNVTKDENIGKTGIINCDINKDGFINIRDIAEDRNCENEVREFFNISKNSWEY